MWGWGSWYIAEQHLSCPVDETQSSPYGEPCGAGTVMPGIPAPSRDGYNGQNPAESRQTLL